MYVNTTQLSNRINRYTKNDITVNGMFIPKGTDVTIPISALHRISQYWPDPEQFDPQRYHLYKLSTLNPFPFWVWFFTICIYSLVCWQIWLNLKASFKKETIVKHLMYNWNNCDCHLLRFGIEQRKQLVRFQVWSNKTMWN